MAKEMKKQAKSMKEKRVDKKEKHSDKAQDIKLMKSKIKKDCMK
jgi:hypothetical protein